MPLATRATALFGQLDRWSARHEGRANNRQADAMANLALDDPAAAARGRGAASLASNRRTGATASCGHRWRRRIGRALDRRLTALIGAAGLDLRHLRRPVPESTSRRRECPICEDERQYVGWNGQQWTTLDRAGGDGHGTTRSPRRSRAARASAPSRSRHRAARADGADAARQRHVGLRHASSMTRRSRRCASSAGLPRSPSRTRTSTPAMTDWSARVRRLPGLHPRRRREWVQYRGPGRAALGGRRAGDPAGVTLINTGGHFAGAQVLHWAAGADGRGAC